MAVVEKELSKHEDDEDNYEEEPPPLGRYSSTGFDNAWAGDISGMSGSWGMPPTAEERGKKAARLRKVAATRTKTVLSRIILWKEVGLTVEDVQSGNVRRGEGY